MEQKTRLNVFLDIETIPSQNPDFKDIVVEPPGTIKKQETLDKWEIEKKPGLVDEKYRKQSFDGTKGEIIVIGWAVEDEEPKSVYRDITNKNYDSEDVILDQFYSQIFKAVAQEGGFHRPIRWVGHRVLAFDLAFIWQRTKINRIPSSVKIPYDAKPWDDCIFDTQERWKARSNASSSLKDIRTAFWLESKRGMDSSEVWDYAKDGRVEEIDQHCREDVSDVRELYHLMQD